MNEETSAPTTADKLRGATRSKLMWLGMAVTALGVVQEQWNLLKPLVEEHPKAAGAALMVVGILIKVFRWLTTNGLADKAS